MIVDTFIDIFYATATQMVKLIVPIIVIILVFKFISGMLLRDGRI